jgi:ubiquitin-like-conjugating enzyme ATG3
METLEISKNKAVKSIPSDFGDQDEDIPDMADYEEPDNLIETDAVSFYILCCSKNGTYR